MTTLQAARIDASLDRWQEAHFFIHNMESFYHDADGFRYSLNAFLRALKEVPQLIQMESQNRPGFSHWYRQRRENLRSDPLIGFLAEKRDFVVHRGMFVPKSNGVIGITEGRGIKAGLSLPIHPLEDSDLAMDRLLIVLKLKRGDPLDVLAPDEESMPCVYREWKIDPFDEELLDLCAKAWLRVEGLVREVICWLGETVPPPSLECRHVPQQIQFKLYNRDRLRQRMAELPDPEADA